MSGMSIQQYAALSSILFAAKVDINDVYDDAIHGIFNTSDTESTIPITIKEVTKTKEEKW